MNLETYKKYTFIVAGVILVFILITIVTVVFQSNTQKKTQDQIVPKAQNIIEPTDSKVEDLPTNVQQIRDELISNYLEDNRGDLLLKTGSNYKIQYITAPDYFFVTINSEPVNEAKNESQNWFKGFGLNQEDLCGLPVRFILTNNLLRENNPDFSSSPDGC